MLLLTLSGVLLKGGPGHVGGIWGLVFLSRVWKQKQQNKPQLSGRITSPSPSVPESETSKMLCVSNASLIMQIQLSPNQVKQTFVQVGVCVYMCVGFHDLRKPKLFIWLGRGA